MTIILKSIIAKEPHEKSMYNDVGEFLTGRQLSTIPRIVAYPDDTNKMGFVDRLVNVGKYL